MTVVHGTLLIIVMGVAYVECSTEGMAKVKEVVKPFDWTFTTNYMGTISSKGGTKFEVITFIKPI